MNDAVAVALEFGARRGGGFGMQPPAGLVGMRGVGCEWGHGRDAWSMSGEANAASVQHSEACRNRRNPAGTVRSTPRVAIGAASLPASAPAPAAPLSGWYRRSG